MAQPIRQAKFKIGDAVMVTDFAYSRFEDGEGSFTV